MLFYLTNIDCSDTDNGATDNYGTGCSYYNSNPNACGQYDDDDFFSNTMCCRCKECVDSNNGATDSYGDGCSYYENSPSACGTADDDDFISNIMCCACNTIRKWY